MNEIAAQVAQAARLLRNANYTVALSGAGISTPSGIPDFRSARAGLWEKVDPMEVASLGSFIKNPAAFYDWMRPLAQQIMDAKPNPAHRALAELESMGLLEAVITQNIDLLHSRAGSQAVYEVHGHIRECTCIGCYTVYPAQALLEQFIVDGEVPHCVACNGVLKPNVVLFGEELPVAQVLGIQKAIRKTDLLIVVGSSLEVYPVADLPRQAHKNGAKIVIVNFDRTNFDKLADVVIRADVAEVLPAIVSELKRHE